MTTPAPPSDSADSPRPVSHSTSHSAPASLEAASTSTEARSSSVLRPRLWPAWAVLALQLGAFIASVTPSINNGVRFGFMMLGPAVCVLLFGAWLVLLSRLPWKERGLFVLAALVTLAVVASLTHSSARIGVWIHGAPLSMLALTVGLAVFGRLPTPARFGRTAVLNLAVIGLLTLFKLEGFTGDYFPEYSWRWAPAAEERLQAVVEAKPEAPTADSGSSSDGAFEPPPWNPEQIDWPGFRGPTYDSRAAGAFEPLDWKARPPVETWRIDVGPGWSSFAAVSGRLFTQEQLGDSELVVCYDAATGRRIWTHHESSRFSDVVAGAGPRATPTYSAGKLYTYGARAVLTCLDAQSGRPLWRRDLMLEIGAKLPVWGFSSSPVVANGVVIVFADGRSQHGLVAYDAQTGEPRWQIESSGMNYSSAQPAKLGGRSLVLFSDPTGVQAIDPVDGRTIWKYKPSGWRGMVLCQPQAIDETSILVPLGDGIGMTRLSVARKGDEWQIDEVWSTNQMKPSFNDFVYYDGHCYGFDQHLFVCLDAATGKRRWKQGRYGFGQVVLLPDVGQLIVAAESGEVVLLAADPSKHRELARLPAIEGKTWNHPIVFDGALFHRNGAEAIRWQLAPRPSPQSLESARSSTRPTPASELPGESP